MENENQIYSNQVNDEHLICWRSTFAALPIALLTFSGVAALALLIGGVSLFDGASVGRAGLFAELSFLVALGVSTFLGSYFSVRVRNYGDETSANTQSVLMAALVLLMIFMGVASSIGAIGKSVGSMAGRAVSTVGGAGVPAMQSSFTQDLVEDGLGQLNLRSSPEVVLRGVTSRLVNGNPEDAKNYLAAQAGLTPAEANQKIALAKSKVDEAMMRAREASASALQVAGWNLLASIVLGLLTALWGGRMAFRARQWSLKFTPRSHFKRAYQS